MSQAISMSKKRKIFILLSLVLSFALLFVVITDIPVFAATVKLVDNDDGNGHNNSQNGTWYYLYQGYGNNARQRVSNLDSYYYGYVYDTPVVRYGVFTVDLEVYLNDPGFTDTDAAYKVWYSWNNDTQNNYVTRWINQNTAYAGWNTLSTMTCASSTPNYTHKSKYTRVYCSGLSSQLYTGADAIYITYN